MQMNIGKEKLRRMLLHQKFITFCLERELGLMEKPEEKPEPSILKFFYYEHLRQDLMPVSKPFHDLACQLCAQLDPGPERTVALRKLLEAKDAAVRAKLYPGS